MGTKAHIVKKETIATWFTSLQASICQALENTDGGAVFQEDQWERPTTLSSSSSPEASDPRTPTPRASVSEGGGGRSRVLQNGNIIEKGGVNFSAVHGPMPEKITAKLKLAPGNFYATGVSIVIHPKNPWVPIIHMNVRYFEMDSGMWWFGGGIDLTPHYVDKEDATHFHTVLKNTCNKHDDAFYPRFKQWADDYFFIRHRNETRGIGGIFFDRLNTESTGKTKEELFAFVKDVGESFAPLYTHYMKKNHPLPYGEKELHWQLIRRSRYVEFNLVYDAGTKFGLDTGGRTESILMSMPPMAKWVYDYTPPEGSGEHASLQLLKKGITWSN